VEKRRQWAHQTSLTRLSLLQMIAYEMYRSNVNLPMEYDEWGQEQAAKLPQICYWNTVNKSGTSS
jgi:hypothetical protein